ncbi:MAG: hypothetical protein C4334_02665 [Pyrinomonas sp.]
MDPRHIPEPNARVAELKVLGDYKKHQTLSHPSQRQSKSPSSAESSHTGARLGTSVEVPIGERSVSVRANVGGASNTAASNSNADRQETRLTSQGQTAVEASKGTSSRPQTTATEEKRRSQPERSGKTTAAPDERSSGERLSRASKGSGRTDQPPFEEAPRETARAHGKHHRETSINLSANSDASLNSTQLRVRKQTDSGAAPTQEMADPIEQFLAILGSAKGTKRAARGAEQLFSSLLKETFASDQHERLTSPTLRAALDEFTQAVARLSGRNDGGRQALAEAVDRFLQAVQLDKYLQRAGRASSEAVRQAEANIARALYASNSELARRATQQLPYAGEMSGLLLERLRPTVAEALRDLRAGLFLPAQEARGPFILNERARVVTELMELARALDGIERLARALERFEGQISQEANQTTGMRPLLIEGDGEASRSLAPSLALEFAGLAPEARAELESLLSLLSQALPGRAGRNGTFHFIVAADGMLVDPQGRFLALRDTGTPLKLNQLLLFVTAQGTLEGPAEPMTSRPAPLLLYGLDALYSMIGFDGRTLAAPHFAAIHTNIEGARPEWVFGHEELSEGWLRAIIERLKDSANVQHNALGEMLEEALADGRFHLILINGSPAEESYHVGAFFPGAQARIAA